MTMPVNDADNADHVWVQLIVDRVRISVEHGAAQQSANDEVLLRRGRDLHQRGVDSIQEALGGR